jgi:hypothetical protein
MLGNMIGCELDGEELMLHKLHNMTAYQFLTKVLITLQDETAIDLLKQQ